MTWTIPRESTFTKPRKDCLHPEWWTSENYNATEQELSQLVAAFVRAWQPELVVEVGTHYGQTAELIGLALRANGHGRCISLEIDHDMAGSGRYRCQGVTDTVEIINIDSLEYIPPQPINLLFIDGHIQRVRDLEHFLPYCEPGALILIHDMANAGCFDQLQRIYELAGEQHVLLNTPRGLLIIKTYDERFDTTPIS